MKQFHISDVLSVTTPYLLSSRHMEGVYEILNFLTKDNLYTHQLPRAAGEAKEWLRAQFPMLMDDAPEMKEMCAEFTRQIEQVSTSERGAFCGQFIESVRRKFILPEMLTVYEMGEDMHTHIDPVEELRAMVGNDKIIVAG